MARKKTVGEKPLQEKLSRKEEEQRKLLAKLGLMQMMFDFYTAPVV